MTDKTIVTKSAFDDLLTDLGVMVKALPAAGGCAAADDKVVDGKDAADGAADAGAVDGDADAGGAADGENVVKSFKLKLDDGTEVDAVDGSEMIKSLQVRIEKNEADLATIIGQSLTIIKSQGEMIKALQGKVETFAKGGVGRKAVLSISERPAAAAAAVVDDKLAGPSPEEFMSKTLVAQAAGRITGTDVSRAESYLNRGLQPPANIVAAVLANEK